jgi:hypothetical protein
MSLIPFAPFGELGQHGLEIFDPSVFCPPISDLIQLALSSSDSSFSQSHLRRRRGFGSIVATCVLL